MKINNANITEKPALFKYQDFAKQTLIRRQGRSTVIARPGSGKTRILLEAADYLLGISSGSYKPILVVCSGPALATWQTQTPYWLNVDPAEIYVVEGKADQRKSIWLRALNGYPGFYICNYSVFMRDYELLMQIQKRGIWGGVLADEYQRTMRGHNTKTFKNFRALARHLPMCLLGTGSPIRKHPATMWTLFNLADEKLFSSYWRFVAQFCITDGGEHNNIIGPKNIEAFKEILFQYLAYIPSEQIQDQLPKGFRSSMYVQLSKPQEKVYKALEDEMVAILDSGTMVVAPNKMTEVLRMRQLLCCPKLLDPTLDMGGGFEAILNDLEDQANPIEKGETGKSNGHCVIFVPFRKACDFVQQALYEHGYKDVFILRGGVTSTEQQEIVHKFTQTQGIMVCTIQYAESYELISANLAYFLGYAYTVDENEQAEGRIQRASSSYGGVFWRYIHYPGTIDDHFFLELNQANINQRTVMQRPSRAVEKLRQLGLH